jgi:hypothetical protein
MNGMPASSQPVLKHRQQNVIGEEEPELGQVVDVRPVVVVLLLERGQDGEQALDGGRLVPFGASRDARTKA